VLHHQTGEKKIERNLAWVRPEAAPGQEFGLLEVPASRRAIAQPAQREANRWDPVRAPAGKACSRVSVPASIWRKSLRRAAMVEG